MIRKLLNYFSSKSQTEWDIQAVEQLAEELGKEYFQSFLLNPLESESSSQKICTVKEHG